MNEPLRALLGELSHTQCPTLVYQGVISIYPSSGRTLYFQFADSINVLVTAVDLAQRWLNNPRKVLAEWQYQVGDQEWSLERWERKRHKRTQLTPAYSNIYPKVRYVQKILWFLPPDGCDQRCVSPQPSSKSSLKA